MSREQSQTNGVLESLALRRAQKEGLIEDAPHLSRWIEGLSPIDTELLVATLAGTELGPMAQRLNTTVIVLEERREVLRIEWQTISLERSRSVHPSSRSDTTPSSPKTG